LENNKNNISLKLKIQLGKYSFFGPGKIYLLETIIETGSISSAAKKIGMSYRKAWKLVTDLNKLSNKKLILTYTGGKGIGGAKITKEGLSLISLYRRIEKKAFLGMKKEKVELDKIINH
tara:strand:- start:1398 stop:1754 length:357 start_codon:yes stop_codon:yes gene_type:complete